MNLILFFKIISINNILFKSFFKTYNSIFYYIYIVSTRSHTQSVLKCFNLIRKKKFRESGYKRNF